MAKALIVVEVDTNDYSEVDNIAEIMMDGYYQYMECECDKEDEDYFQADMSATYLKDVGIEDVTKHFEGNEFLKDDETSEEEQPNIIDEKLRDKVLSAIKRYKPYIKANTESEFEAHIDTSSISYVKIIIDEYDQVVVSSINDDCNGTVMWSTVPRYEYNEYDEEQAREENIIPHIPDYAINFGINIRSAIEVAKKYECM